MALNCYSGLPGTVNTVFSLLIGFEWYLPKRRLLIQLRKCNTCPIVD